MTDDQQSAAVRDYLAAIGRKGGKCSAQATSAAFKSKRGAKGGRAGKGKLKPRKALAKVDETS